MYKKAKNALLECGSVLNQLSRSQAQWELSMSREILGKRRGLLVAALTPVLILLALQAAHAAGLIPKGIPFLGGSKAYMPSFLGPQMFCGSIFVGLVAGLITGVIGAGGGYILTPALMSFGVRGIMAVGTDQFHLFAKAIMATTIHKKLGNVNVGLAAWFVVGSLVGVTCGGTLSRTIFQHSPAASDALISGVYVVVLGILGAYSIYDWRRLRACSAKGVECEATTAFAKRLQALPLAPKVAFDQDIVPGGRRISVYPVIFCGFVVGLFASIMGVGGGFLTFPMFVYGLGVSTFTTVGTDILQIIFTTSYSSIFQYAIFGFVFYTVSVGMLLGSLVGVQIGAMVTKVVAGSVIRALYALTILAGFANRCCALPKKLSDLGYISLSRPVSVWIETAGNVVFFAIIGVFAVWIVGAFFVNMAALRPDASSPKHATKGRLVTDPRKLKLGLAGLAVFIAVLAAGLSPITSRGNALVWADGVLNELAKSSSVSFPDARKQVAKQLGKSVDLGVKPKEPVSKEDVVRLIRMNGAEARLDGQDKVRITGDLGNLASAALVDAELAYRNQSGALEEKYGTKGYGAICCWWAIFDGLTRGYVRESKSKEANFASFMATKVLEPAYNFRGIRPNGIKDKAVPATLLLAFYVLYTIWYGFSILLIFEGLGISAKAASVKKEA